MLTRFFLYSIFKNLRLFERFFVIYLLAPVEQAGAGLSYLAIGSLVGYQRVVTALLEVPSGVVADRWGRRRSLVLCFGLYTLAFPAYAIASSWPPTSRLVLLCVAQTLFGVAEAFRTGTHKAIMLDWADATGHAAGSVRVIGVTRMASKVTAGMSALLGAVVLFVGGSFTPLFWASTAPALAGVFLMLGYPAWLDGEQARDSEPSSPWTWRDHVRRLLGRSGFAPLMLGSIAFESQVKLGQHYLQPLLYEGIRDRDVSVVGGVGALAVGAYYLIQDTTGGFASLLAGPLHRRWGGVRSLRMVHATAAVVAIAVAVSVGWKWLTAAALGFVLLAVLQNARRPVFVSTLNAFMDSSQRATVLSVESQARGLAFGLCAPVTGWLADRYGLASALAAVALVLAAASLLRVRDPAKSSGA